MVDLRTKIAALQRLADNPGATSHEKENALRRIKQIEERHGINHKKDEQQQFGRQPGFGYSNMSFVDLMRAMARDLGIDFDDQMRPIYSGRNGPASRPRRSEQCYDVGETPRASWDDFAVGADGERPPVHPNCRCHHHPHPFPGELFNSGWLEYQLINSPGRYGRVKTFSMDRDLRTMDTIFSWACPKCGKLASLRISEDVFIDAYNTSEAMRSIGTDLFQRLNGERDNMCEACSARYSKIRFDGRRLSEFADFVMARWEEFKNLGNQGPYGYVEHLARHPVTDEHVDFQWKCRGCGQICRYRIDWREVSKLVKNGLVEEFLGHRLFRIFSGYDDNRCDNCSGK